MTLFREWRIRQAKQRLAGLNAKYDSFSRLTPGQKLPMYVIEEFQRVAQEIGEVGELVRQLEESR